MSENIKMVERLLNEWSSDKDAWSALWLLYD